MSLRYVQQRGECGTVHENEGFALVWGQQESGKLHFLEGSAKVWYSGNAVKNK